MTFRFIHTSDWQIGKVFRFVDDATMGVLQEARLEAITRLGELAEQHGACHVLVAGDVYDAVGLSQRSLTQPLERMRAHGGVRWHLLPGNHDPHQPNGLWDRLCARGLPPNVSVHTEPAPVVLDDGAAALLPAPLRHRRALVDPTAWMDAAETPEGALRIALAHGSVREFGSTPGQTANLIDVERPSRARLDYLALGDWHGQQQISDRCWYSGTPETDAFDVQGGGKALLVEVEANDQPRTTPLETGKFRWLRIAERLGERGDIDALEQRLRNLDDAANTLVALKLEGALSFADAQYFDERIADGASHLLRYLGIDRDRLYAQPTADDLDRIDTGGVVRSAVEALRRQAEGATDDGDAELANEALLHLYVEYMKLESAAQ